MAKMIIFILSALLTVASATGYYILNDRITGGEKLLAAGQKRYDEGQRELKAGRAKLSAGKKKLSKAKGAFGFLSTPLKVLVPATSTTAVVSTVVLTGTEEKLKEGDKQVASGQKKIREGEAQLKAGRAKLSQGKGQLAYAKKIRFYLMLSTIFFAVITFIFLFLWMRSRRCARM